MDLSKAKTLLILAFLSLNIFLGYKLWIAPQALHQGSVLTEEQLAQAKALIKEHGFELKTTLPKQIPRLALLNVSRLATDDSHWLAAFWGEEKVQSRRETDKTVYTAGQEALTILADGHLVYTNNLPGTSEANTRSLAERYLREWQLWQGNMKLDLAIPWGEHGYRYRFVQNYQGFPLFFSAIEVYLAEGRPREVHLYQALPHGFSDKEATVISAQKAVETFMREAAEISNKSIIDISLGYYSLSYDAERWESAPVWRIATQGGSESYINAFTGEIEKSTL
ncbi:MAG TPA: two-component system regulatory protein YycI [Oscillospiraceae bacterium]|nr:two-component system regulatory protein YycI [Oscillospiraceae bacterium]